MDFGRENLLKISLIMTTRVGTGESCNPLQGRLTLDLKIPPEKT
jgi:hypothetical protein